MIAAGRFSELNDKFSGEAFKGEMRYASGASHRGLWERGERNGSGVFVDVDGGRVLGRVFGRGRGRGGVFFGVLE